MAIMQTAADIGGQATRIALYFGSGVASGVALANGIITEDLVAQIPVLLGAIVTLGASLGWWVNAQKKLASVAGLVESSAPGSNKAAIELEKVIDEVRKT